MALNCCGHSESLTFDIIETGSAHPFTEVDERPLRLTARENVVVVCHSDDAMGGHGWYLLQHLLIGSFSSGRETKKGFQDGSDQPALNTSASGDLADAHN